MAENTMLYFRSVADEDNDDGAESAATNLTSLLKQQLLFRYQEQLGTLLMTLLSAAQWKALISKL